LKESHAHKHAYRKGRITPYSFHPPSDSFVVEACSDLFAFC